MVGGVDPWGVMNPAVFATKFIAAKNLLKSNLCGFCERILSVQMQVVYLSY